MSKLAPIVLFVYNRPWHTEQTLSALMANDLANESTLYIYADGPKPSATLEQIKQIEEVSTLIRSKKWCKEVIIIQSKTNKGLADSIVSGVTEVVTKHGTVIVLEDDIVTSKGFLKFMNDALDIYKLDEDIMHISGYVYPYSIKPTQETFFLRIFSCWGWATWARAWKNYNHDIDVHLRNFSSSEDIKKFDIEGNANFFLQLQGNKDNRIYTWAVRWYASWLANHGLSLFPYKSLITNIGFDDSGEHHHHESDKFKVEIIDNVEVLRLSKVEDLRIRQSISLFFRRVNHKSITSKISLKIKNLFS